MKRLLALLLCLLLTIGICPFALAEEDLVGAASAGLYVPEDGGEAAADDAMDGSGEFTDEIAEEGASLSDISGYTHNSAYSERTLCKGIDVSTFQGDIDWAKVKAAGVEFAIIRVGGRYSGSGNFYEDGRAIQNISGALAQGIDVGAYFFSQAITTAEAKAEAAEALRVLGSYASKLTLPIYLDVEYVNNGGRLKSAGLSTTEQTNIAIAFCDAIYEAGYDAGVYAGFCTFGISEKTISDAGYEVWHAQWYNRATIDPVYTTWQFSAHGSVSGISGEVDLDFRYRDDTPKTQVTRFTDVKMRNWFYDSVNFVVSKGYFNGMGNGEFKPSAAMNREMFATVLYRLAGSPAVSGESTFTDVTDKTAWYYNAVVWGAQNKIVSGLSETVFGKGRTITRQEMVTLLYRYAKFIKLDTANNQSLDSFPDASDAATWAKDAMSWAVAEGIISGISSTQGGAAVTKLQPKDATSRAQVATVIQRFSQLIDTAETQEAEQTEDPTENPAENPAENPTENPGETQNEEQN